MEPVAIGIDVGGTKIAGALIAANGTATQEMTVQTPRSADGVDPEAAATASLVELLLVSARTSGLPVSAVGIGIPEYVTPEGRIGSAEVLAWGSAGLEALRTDVDVDVVVVESDVRCAALAESVIGDGNGFDSFLFVSIGTGVSHTLSLGGRPLTGHRGEAIALGEFPVDSAVALRPSAPLTIEQQASGRAIELLQEELASAGRHPWSDEELRARAGRIMATAIAVVVGLVDPEAVILGGGLGTSSGAYTDSLIAEAEVLLSRRPNAPLIVRSRLGNRGGVIGAGLAAHRNTPVTPTPTAEGR